jgi:hypothetical protein
MIVLGVAGLPLAGVLAVRSRDLHAATQTGPAWNRQILVAAMPAPAR